MFIRIRRATSSGRTPGDTLVSQADIVLVDTVWTGRASDQRILISLRTGDRIEAVGTVQDFLNRMMLGDQEDEADG